MQRTFRCSFQQGEFCSFNRSSGPNIGFSPSELTLPGTVRRELFNRHANGVHDQRDGFGDIQSLADDRSRETPG
jgi:hypothetical protein